MGERGNRTTWNRSQTASKPSPYARRSSLHSCFLSSVFAWLSWTIFFFPFYPFEKQLYELFRIHAYQSQHICEMPASNQGVNICWAFKVGEVLPEVERPIY